MSCTREDRSSDDETRRGFLIGTGGLLTMAFVRDARAFIRRKEAPLLAAPPCTAHTLYWDWPDGLDATATVPR